MRHVDGPMFQLREALNGTVIDDAMRYAKRCLQPLLDTAVRLHGTYGVCGGEQSALVLGRCIESTTAAIAAEYDGYSSLRWLWMLRRLPESTFKGELLTTTTYDRTLAEIIAGQSRGRSRMEKVGALRAYPLDATVVRRLARYVASIKWLSGLHRNYRWAGKGCSFEFTRGEIPREVPDRALRASVGLYDKRVERSGGVGRMGTEVFQPSGSAVDIRSLLKIASGDPHSMFVRVVQIQQIELQVPAPDADLFAEDISKVPTVSVRARYMVIPVPMASLDALVKEAPPDERPILDKPAAALLFLLFASTVHVVDHRAGFLGLFTTGYLISDEEFFRSRIVEVLPTTPKPLKEILDRAGVNSPDEIIGLLDAMKGNPWPREAGPILYRDQDAFAVDLVAAGSRLGDSVVFPRVQGELANIRSEHFELRVQTAVDSSRHAPPQEIRALRGRTLKLRGLDVTDLDAVACVGKTLLLISCKSIIYSPEYDQGEYRAVRNAATMARTAQHQWDTVLTKLKANPRGDNYDLTGWNLVGVVCTSSIVWIELGPCTAFVMDGLRWVVSLAELQDWLKQQRPT